MASEVHGGLGRQSVNRQTKSKRKRARRAGASKRAPRRPINKRLGKFAPPKNYMALAPLAVDRFEWLRLSAFEAIAEARKRLDPDYIWLPEEPSAKEAAMDQAKEFLHELRKEARAKGKRRGDKATADENRKALDTLSKLCLGKSLKNIAIEETAKPDGTTGNYAKREKLLRMRVKRMSRRVCEAVRKTYGCVPNGLLTQSALSDAYLAHPFRKWPGVQMPRDLHAIRKALNLNQA